MQVTYIDNNAIDAICHTYTEQLENYNPPITWPEVVNNACGWIGGAIMVCALFWFLWKINED